MAYTLLIFIPIIIIFFLFTLRTRWKEVALHNRQCLVSLLIARFDNVLCHSPITKDATELALHSKTRPMINVRDFAEVFKIIIAEYECLITKQFHFPTSEMQKDFSAAIKASAISLFLYTYEFNPYMINHEELNDAILEVYSKDLQIQKYLKHFHDTFPKPDFALHYSQRETHEAIIRESLIDWFADSFQRKNRLYAHINNWLTIVFSSGTIFLKHFTHTGGDYVTIEIK